MNIPEKTHSETLFERYLDGEGIRWEREPIITGKLKHPDYGVEQAGKLYWFEVKEFEDPEVKERGFSPCPAVAEKINQARKQFKEFKKDCCALVLHNCKTVYRSTHPPAVLSAAFGEYLQIEAQSSGTFMEPCRFKFSGRSKLEKDRNTSISALIILQHYEVHERLVAAFHELRERQASGEKLGPFAYAEILESRKDYPSTITHADSVRTIVLQNPYARIPLPESFFHGPFDQRWGRASGSDWYTLLWMGSELEGLRARPKPVPFVFL